jgi:hypothetical protein
MKDAVNACIQNSNTFEVSDLLQPLPDYLLGKRLKSKPGETW